VLAGLALVFMHDNRGDVRLSFVFFAVDLPLVVVIALFTALGALAGGGAALRLARRRVLRRRGDRLTPGAREGGGHAPRRASPPEERGTPGRGGS
jgi:uncharacterized integral membrane protein